jgi:eukaryotic-like serine/threonine-protein kinase
MASQNNAPLADGLEIGGYRIVRKIASGGFSIVYLAEDDVGHKFAIKEYLPSNLVKREPGEHIPVIASDNLATYRNGLKCFFEEGRSLAKIFHPNIVRVVNFFRGNETVYMVMAYEQGRSLQEIVLRNRGKTDKVVVAERHIRAIFNQVMNGLREVHANRMLHLDLKPANIYLRIDGTPILLDFGAARQTLGVEGPKLFPMYTPGFAGTELYRRTKPLGPWTDVYGVGASMYACMMGSPPQPADQRELNDKMPANLQNLVGPYSQNLVDTVSWCLKLDALERPQSVFALQRALRKGQWRDEPSTRTKPVESWFDSIAGKFSRKREKAVAKNDTGISLPT